MSAQQTVLITGANRGIGRGLLATYLARANTTAIAAVRDTSSSTSKSLSELPLGAGSKLITVKIDASSETDAFTAVKILQGDHSITSLDIVIANAGMAEFNGTVLQENVKSFKNHLNINVIGVMVLFQAVEPLLREAKKPKFVALSSAVGSIGDLENWPMGAVAYGTSKAALNWIVKEIHIENPNVIAFPIHPGWVQTEMGNAGAASKGMAEAPLTLKESVAAIIEQVDGATKEKTSGTFVSYDGEHISW